MIGTPAPDAGGRPPARGTAVRRLGPGDLPAAHAMLDLFAEAFDDPATYAAARPDGAYLARLLADEAVVALAAFDGDAVVGAAVAYELRKFEQARSEMYLYDLAVAPSWRRRGIATALIDALREIAFRRGAWMVFVQADRGDDPAIALYSRLGVREDVLHFDIEPRPRGAAD